MTYIINMDTYLTLKTAEIFIEDDQWHAVESLHSIMEAALAPPALATDQSFSILLTNDDHLQQLNRDFRGKDKPTNVLSFPSVDEEYLGDIAIAYETLAREAEAQEKTFHHHLTHILIHGVLHLQGYDHETDAEAEEMESLEIKILADMGIKNPYDE